MRSLKSKTNVVAPTSDYPYARIKDNPGDGTGTPVNELVYGDIHQFFERLMVKAGIVANGLPDNNYSGFQLEDALEGRINQLIANEDTPFANIPLLNGWVSSGTPSVSWRKDAKGRVYLRGTLVAGAGSNVITAAGAVPNPISSTALEFMVLNSSAVSVARLTLSPAGLLTMTNGYTNGNLYTIEGVNYSTV